MKFFPFILIFFAISYLCANDAGRTWIFFTDKGQVSLEKANMALSKRSVERRAARGSQLDQSDLPVFPAYIAGLKAAGITIYRKSRWFNGVSAYLNGVPEEDILSLPYVLSVGPVQALPAEKQPESESEALRKITEIAYGPSYNQNEMLGVPLMHELGYTGKNVRIALFDTGFLLEHEALKSIVVTNTYDFIQNDTNVSDDNNDIPGQHNHGTKVLGAIGGFAPSHLIGPAYESEYILAKTEVFRSETHVEEDNWVAAAEWADSLGTDIISSSLGYSVFDDGEGDYTYQDLDGKTTIITRAAVMAVNKGIAVFTSAGNEGSSQWHYITAPADGDGVIAVGGVRPDGTLWPTSSRGPTADGRIKPDLATQGQSVYSVIPGSLDLYATGSGTSFSSPLAAGAAALLLSIAPDLNPSQLRQLMISTASQSKLPDNDLGYGLIDLKKAAAILQEDHEVNLESFTVTTLAGENQLNWVAVLEILNQSWIISRKSEDEEEQIIASIDGEIFNLNPKSYKFSDVNISGGKFYTYTLSSRSLENIITIVDTVTVQSQIPDNLNIVSVYPNPFNSFSTILFSIKSAGRMDLQIYDVLGRKIRTLMKSEQRSADYYRIQWDGRNDNGVPVSSGNYFILLKSGDKTDWHSLVLIK